MVLRKVSFSLLLITLITSNVVVSGVTTFGNYTEGQNCGTNSEGNGYFGKCLKIKTCLSTFNEYENNQGVLQVCGYSANKNAKEVLICCSKDDLEKSKEEEPWLGIEKSLEYNECAFRYLKYREKYQGNPTGSTSSIAKGSAAFRGEFPNMVAIGWTQDDKTVEYKCGGSIITELFIVTAAHCTSDGELKPDVVRIGDLDLLSNTDDEDVQQLNVESIIRHPKHKFRINYDDIALIKVDREIKMNRYVTPACIQYDSKYVHFEAAGYGETGPFEEKANKLLKVSFQHVNQNECKMFYDDIGDRRLRLGIVEDQLCAKVSVINGIKKDTCNGDGGSGLQYNNRLKIGKTVYQIPTLVGIVSFGVSCGKGLPSVFTNVTSYVDWMESVIFAE